MKYINLIETYYPHFSKQEKKLADFIFEEKEKISIMSLQEITKKIQVSESTIVRFVRKLGFKGFIEFKLEIAKQSNQTKKIKTTDYIEDITNDIFSVISSTKNLLKKEDIDEVTRLITKSRDLYFFGLGASGIAAQEYKHKFMRFGKISQAIIDSHFQTMYASMVKKEDLIIVISLSGETQELIYPLNIAKERGCKIVVITNYILSPISKMADIVLLTAGKETPLDGGSLSSKISQLFILDVLATTYALKNSNAKKVRQHMATVIANKK